MNSKTFKKLKQKRHLDNGVQKDKVFSFRLPTSAWNRIAEELEKHPISGCPNPHTFTRKLLKDWMLGRLKYRDPKHRFVDATDDTKAVTETWTIILRQPSGGVIFLCQQSGKSDTTTNQSEAFQFQDKMEAIRAAIPYPQAEVVADYGKPNQHTVYAGDATVTARAKDDRP